MHEPPPPAHALADRPARRLRSRLAWLLACIAGGGAIGAVGHALSGEPIWYAAITVALAIGWWVLADPTACVRPDQRR